MTLSEAKHDAEPRAQRIERPTADDGMAATSHSTACCGLCALRSGTAPRAVVTTKEGEAFAAANNLAFFEVSAATGADVDEPFNFIANQVHQKYEATVQSAELLASTTIPTEAGHP